MEIQISAGQGPAECELAVAKLCAALRQEFGGVSLAASLPGSRPGGYKSAVLQGPPQLAGLEGSVLWRCQSPYRPAHKRKNWFVDISLTARPETHSLNPQEIRFETFHCGGHGGQHVNKVETGVRALYAPLGLAAESTTARSQHMNKRLALNRLCEMLAAGNHRLQAEAAALNRLEHTRLVRGAPVRIYEGPGFARVE